MPDTATLDSLIDLYVHELKDMYSAEKQIINALPKMAKRASSGTLQNTFQKHLKQTKEHVDRVGNILRRLEQKPNGITPCRGMKGIIQESSSFLKAKGSPEVLDAALITAAQRAEHYKIAGYGTLCSFASLLGQRQDYDLLCQTLKEEKTADQKLTAIAEGGVNEDAQPDIEMVCTSAEAAELRKYFQKELSPQSIAKQKSPVR